MHGAPSVYVFFHGEMLPLLAAAGRPGITTLVSLSRDGARATQVLAGFGMHAVRGSSSRGGGAALRALLGQLRRGRSVALAVDGPRGPRGEVGPGALHLARISRCPLVPAAAAGWPATHLSSWDRFCVPWPFARVAVAFGEAMQVRDARDPGLPEQVAEAIATAQRQVRSALPEPVVDRRILHQPE